MFYLWTCHSWIVWKVLFFCWLIWATLESSKVCPAIFSPSYWVLERVGVYLMLQDILWWNVDKLPQNLFHLAIWEVGLHCLISHLWIFLHQSFSCLVFWQTVFYFCVHDREQQSLEDDRMKYAQVYCHRLDHQMSL